MSVIKVKIQKDFTVLYNGVLENPRLSFRAKGLWAFCMSKSEDWQFRVNHLATVSKEKKSLIYKAFDELIQEGLVERSQPNQEKGRFGKVEYTVYPYPQELKKCLPRSDFPHAVKSPLPSTEEKPITEEEELEIDKRFRERPKGLKPVVSITGWRKKVLAEIRKEKKREASKAKADEDRSEERERNSNEARKVVEEYGQSPAKWVGRITCDGQGNLYCSAKLDNEPISPTLTKEEWEIRVNRWRKP